uniref:Transposable element P transposase n=1 Tax=Amphimedon queenslandica TaxID=400682 RepID=A0A1X7U031_AMPQE
MKQSRIELPTRSTLNDYTHWISAKPGFSHEVDMFLRSEAKIDELEEWQRFVVLILDEIKIQEDLVFDKSGHRLHGFVNLGDINRELKAHDDQASDSFCASSNIATHVLTLMVRGIFIKLEFPYANFPTQNVTADDLYWIVWEAVRCLEEINLKVIVFVCDGAKPNRKFLSMLGQREHLKDGIAYKTINKYCHNRFIYFMSDVPHLIKTARNCWYSSSIGGVRYIIIENTYYGNILRYFKKQMNDKFFDCLNTRHLEEGKRKRKPDLDPYRSVNDRRFKWLVEDFLGYLDEWKKSVEEREGFSIDDKKRTMLSQETLDGIQMTIYGFVEMAQFLISQKEGLYLLSERFNQDPLESFFGQQRARGGRCDNPNVKTFMYNTQAIRVQRTLAIGDGGNVRKRSTQWTTDIDELSRPLKK